MDERGVIAIAMAIIVCFTIVPLAAYAVEIGVQRVARRDVQAVADVVALDLARQLDGRTYSQLHAQLQSLADKSAARNTSVVGTGLAVVPELGSVDDTKYGTSGYFTPITSDAGGIPSAVRVTASTTVSFALHGGTGGATRSAIAKATGAACFQVGSFALSLNSSNSPLLNKLIGDALNINGLSYSGLANANITLLGLAAQLGVGSVDGLLNADLTLNQLYLASAKALQAAGGDTASIALLNQLAVANFGALGHVQLGSILDIASGDNAALSGTLNLLDLVSTSAFLANGTNALAIPDLTVGVPGIGGVTASLKVIEGKQRGCTLNHTIQTSQVALTLHVTLADTNILLLAASSTIDVTLNIAQAQATMTSVLCGNPAGIDVALATALENSSLSLDVELKLLGLSIARVTAGVGTSVNATSQTVSFRHPPDAYGTPKSVGSSGVIPSLSLSDLSLTLLGVLPLGVTNSGLLSGVLNTLVTPIVNPLIANINSLLISPLTQLLGLRLGGADIFVNDPPTCSNPVLAG